MTENDLSAAVSRAADNPEDEKALAAVCAGVLRKAALELVEEQLNRRRRAAEVAAAEIALGNLEDVAAAHEREFRAAAAAAEKATVDRRV